MNPLLQMLLGQQSSGSLPGIIPGFGGGTFNPDGTQVTPVDPLGDEILVQSNRNSREAGSPVDGLSAPNDRAIEAVQADVARGQEASDRRGLFGVKGTLRDVLGLVGDAFLVQGGRDPYYAPRRRQEQISDAMAGFTEDPTSAAERVGYYDPKLGQEILGEAETSLLKKAQLESLKSTRASDIQTEELTRYRKARELIGGLFNTPGAVVNGQINPMALKRAEQIARSAGLTLEDMLINEGMTEQEVRDYATSVLDPYKQERLEDYDTGLEQGQYNAESRRISAEAARTRANRPPAGRAPSKPTEASEVARIRAKLNRGESLSPGDKATWDKYTRPSSSDRRSGRGSTGGQPRFGPPRN